MLIKEEGTLALVDRVVYRTEDGVRLQASQSFHRRKGEATPGYKGKTIERWRVWDCGTMRDNMVRHRR